MKKEKILKCYTYEEESKTQKQSRAEKLCAKRETIIINFDIHANNLMKQAKHRENYE